MSFQFGTLCFVILLPIIPAFILFKALPASGSVDGKLQGLEIKLSGAFAGYFAVVLLIVANHTVLMPVQYQVWTVTGQVQDENGQYIDPLAYANIALEPNPPLTPISPGKFALTFYSSPTSSGPSPTLSISKDDYQTVCYSLDPTMPQTPGCASVKPVGSTIDVGTVVLKKKLPPYPDNLPPIVAPADDANTQTASSGGH
jgi:hypothetical protein